MEKTTITEYVFTQADIESELLEILDDREAQDPGNGTASFGQDDDGEIIVVVTYHDCN